MLTGLLSEGDFINHPRKSWLEQWHPWRVPVEQCHLYLLPLTMWPTVVLLATVSWLLNGCPKRGFLPPPTSPCPTPPHPTLLPIPPTPSIINTDGRKGQQKYLEIQPSEIEKVIYNKNQ